MTRMTRLWEVYGAGVGYLGHVKAHTKREAKAVAARFWPEIDSFAVNPIARVHADAA